MLGTSSDPFDCILPQKQAKQKVGKMNENELTTWQESKANGQCPAGTVHSALPIKRWSMQMTRKK